MIKTISFLLIFFLTWHSYSATLEIGSGKTYSTIADALSAANANDTLLIFDGVYSEYVTVSDAGVTISAAPGSSPWIVGRIVVGQSNVTIRGLGLGGWTNVNAGAIHISGYNGMTIENCTITNAGSSSGSGIYIRNGSNHLIRSNLITTCATGININSGVGSSYETGIRIISNIIATNYFDGLDVHGKYITISDNFIFRNFDTNWVSTHPDGIQLIDSTIDSHRGCQELKIIRNTIYSHPQNIFTGYYMTNIIIANNIFYQEAGTILGVDLDSVTTKHCGLYSGNNLIVVNNFFGRAANSGVYVSYDVSQATGGISVKNNIFVNGLTGYISVYFVNSSDISSWDYNLYYNVPYAGRIASSYYDTAAAVRSSTSYEDNGIDGDPLLNGYIPTEGSPAIGSAADLSVLFTDDFTGATRTVPWDIGAYEYFSSGEHSATANIVNVGIITFP